MQSPASFKITTSVRFKYYYVFHDFLLLFLTVSVPMTTILVDDREPPSLRPRLPASAPVLNMEASFYAELYPQQTLITVSDEILRLILSLLRENRFMTSFTVTHPVNSNDSFLQYAQLAAVSMHVDFQLYPSSWLKVSSSTGLIRSAGEFARTAGQHIR